MRAIILFLKGQQCVQCAHRRRSTITHEGNHAGIHAFSKNGGMRNVFGIIFLSLLPYVLPGFYRDDFTNCLTGKQFHRAIKPVNQDLNSVLIWKQRSEKEIGNPTL
jgi:hypothetical protein